MEAGQVPGHDCACDSILMVVGASWEGVRGDVRLTELVQERRRGLVVIRL